MAAFYTLLYVAPSKEVLRDYSWLTSDQAQQTGSVPPSRRPGSVKANVTARRTGLDTSAFHKWFGTQGLQHCLCW